MLNASEQERAGTERAGDGQTTVVQCSARGVARQERIEVVEERWLQLVVNGRHVANLACSPFDVDCLVVGHLFFRGIIRRAEDVRSLAVSPKPEAWRVQAEVTIDSLGRPLLDAETWETPWPSTKEQVDQFSMSRLDETLSLEPAQVLTSMRELYARATHYQRSRGLHTAALGDGTRLSAVAEDFSRHYAMDKLIGRAMRDGLATRGALVCTTGRLSSGLIHRAHRLGIECLLSRTSPTQLAVEMARRVGLTIVGYIRGDGFTVYSAPARLGLGACFDAPNAR